MKKFFATLMLLVCVSAVFAGSAGDSAINNPKQQSLCHNEAGKWDPQSKDCDPNSCGCFFHQIESFIFGMFE